MTLDPWFFMSRGYCLGESFHSFGGKQGAFILVIGEYLVVARINSSNGEINDDQQKALMGGGRINADTIQVYPRLELDQLTFDHPLNFGNGCR